MSKSARTSSRTSKRGATASAAKAAARPWVIDGVDYGPAIGAVEDLAAWAFDLAAADVADWAEGRRRVRNARRFVLARLRGKQQRAAPFDDILFTASLLVRVFEADFGFGMSQIVEVLDQLGLPTEVVPLLPQIQPSARRSCRPTIVPIRPRPVGVSAAPAAPTGHEECGCFPRFRNAA